MSRTYIYPPVSVQTSSAPIEFINDGVSEQVNYDSVTPGNTKPLPGGLFILKDGVYLPVAKDTGTPANTNPVPVELVGAAGPINITAGDIGVQLTDLGVNFDRTRIGDGVNQWDMNASGEGLVHDADALTELQTISAIDFATEAKQDTQITALGSLLTELQLKADLTETQPVSVQSSALPTGAATEVTLDAVKTAVETLDDTIATDGGAALAKFQTVGGHTGTTSHAWHVDSSGNGRVDVRSSVLPTGAATEATVATLATEATLTSKASEATLATRASETTLSAMSAKLPATLGQKTSANSLAVVVASDQVIPTRENALASGTVTDTTISGATVTTINAPVGARGMKIQAGINNTADLLVGLGGSTPDNTLNIGLEFQGGRSEDIIGASNVEVTSADPAAINQKIVIVWSYV